MKRAFTLIELLVCLVIVAVLAALLLPVLAQARERAHTARRVQEMRQVALALSCYMADGGRPDPRMLLQASLDRELDPYTGRCTARLMHRSPLDRQELAIYYFYPNPQQARPRSVGVYWYPRYKRVVTADDMYGWDVPLGGGPVQFWRRHP